MKIEGNVEGTNLIFGLDRTVVGIKYRRLSKKEQQQPQTPEFLANIAAIQGAFVKELHHIRFVIEHGYPYLPSYTKNKDLQRRVVLSHIDKKRLCNHLSGFMHGNGVNNIEFNPAKLSQDQWLELQWMLGMSFDYGYDELYTRGVVRHAEFFVDVHGVETDQLVLIDKGRRSYHLDKHGMTFCGAKTAPLLCVLYNKSRQLKELEPKSRIEVRINPKVLQLQRLVEGDLSNPFQHFVAVEYRKLQQIANERNDPKLSGLIKHLGLHEAVRNKTARDSILARIEQEAVPWWKPDLIWSTHNQLLNELRPEQSWYKPVECLGIKQGAWYSHHGHSPSADNDDDLY